MRQARWRAVCPSRLRCCVRCPGLEVINPESGRPQPGDLQRLMLMHRESQRKGHWRGSVRCVRRGMSLCLAVTCCTSSQRTSCWRWPATRSRHRIRCIPARRLTAHSPRPRSRPTASFHTASPLLNAAAPPAASSSSSSSFFADLLSFPSRGRKAIRCQFCGKTLNVRVSESGDLLLASSLKRPAAAAAADAAVDVMASKYELCSCLRTRSPLAQHCGPLVRQQRTL